MRRGASLAVAIAAVVAGGCTRGDAETAASARRGGASGGAGAGAGGVGGGADTAAVVPVQAGIVARATLAVTVSGPGRTDVIAEQRIRAPFQGILSGFTAAPGDRVRAGEELGSIVSQTSQSALAGARAMLGAAATPAERADAERAVQLAKFGLVRAPIRAPSGGIVVSRSASAGELVAPGDSLMSIAPAGSLVFVAQLAQSDAALVRPGQPATIALAGAAPVPGVVKTALPADSAAGLTVPIRLSIAQARAPLLPGLFGIASITVSQRTAAITVPVAAVLRDDIAGTSRVAVITPAGTAHWVAVTPGVSQGGLVEIVFPVLELGTRVITMGQAGLPEGVRVRVEQSVAAATGAPATTVATAP